MYRLCLAAAVLLVSGFQTSAESKYRVIDGDTIAVSGSTYRLLGFDTPETFYARCLVELELGRKATLRLEELLAAGNWHVDDTGKTDKFRRRLGRLFIGERDVADIMVEAGLARRYAGKKREGWC